MEQSTQKKPQDENREARKEICDAFKQMTLAHIQRLTASTQITPDEIRSIRECVETIMQLHI